MKGKDPKARPTPSRCWQAKQGISRSQKVRVQPRREVVRTSDRQGGPSHLKRKVKKNCRRGQMALTGETNTVALRESQKTWRKGGQSACAKAS